MNDLLQLAILFVTGLFAGFINVMSAGGSMLSVPMLIFLGLDPNTANGTNRIAIFLQNVSGILTFKSKGAIAAKESLFFAVWTIPGAILGSWIAVKIDPTVFQIILAAIMIISVLALFMPKKKAEQKSGGFRKIFQNNPLIKKIATAIGMFIIGLYGGFIQIGVGFLFLVILYRILDISLVKSTVHKVFIILIYTTPALIIFILAGNVDFKLGLFLALGNSAGAYIAAHVTLKESGESWIKWLSALVIFVMAIRLFVLT